MKKGKWILIVFFCLILVLALVFGPGIYRGARMLGMVSSLWDQASCSLDIRTNTGLELRLDWQDTAPGRVLILETGGAQICYHNGAVYLENGRGYDFSETAAAAENALRQFWKLCPMIKTAQTDGTWTAALAERDLTVTLKPGDPGFGTARVRYEETEIEILPRQDRTASPVPTEVLRAISEGSVQGSGDMTGPLLRLLAAWADLSSRDVLAMELRLTADCGVLKLSDTLQISADRKTGIGYVEKNGRGLYVTPEGVCTADGKLLTDQESAAQSAQLLGAAYLLLLNGDFTVQNDTYTLSLDQAGMERFAYTIAPAAKDLNIAFQSGEILLKLADNRLQSLSVSCSGTLDLILTKVDASIGAELLLKQAEEFVIPQAVLDALS